MNLAEHTLALMQEVTALKSRVAELESMKAAPQIKVPIGTLMRQALAVLRVWGRFLNSPKGQGLLAILTPAVAAFVKWLLGGS
jgi:hypothetical protein